eukprot:TRINITY_DN4262_c0_g1_i2.p1 TRINITY_DN4262_c0_g1~~TRINITY_DN4262_c0_g1_i2.p1  ORF type:complete len:1129 (+),score=235.78 TRINITY_DN4262_c0_g1_i2:21-3407(+)
MLSNSKKKKKRKGSIFRTRSDSKSLSKPPTIFTNVVTKRNRSEKVKKRIKQKMTENLRDQWIRTNMFPPIVRLLVVESKEYIHIEGNCRLIYFTPYSTVAEVIEHSLFVCGITDPQASTRDIREYVARYRAGVGGLKLNKYKCLLDYPVKNYDIFRIWPEEEDITMYIKVTSGTSPIASTVKISKETTAQDLMLMTWKRLADDSVTIIFGLYLKSDNRWLQPEEYLINNVSDGEEIELKEQTTVDTHTSASKVRLRIIILIGEYTCEIEIICDSDSNINSLANTIIKRCPMEGINGCRLFHNSLLNDNSIVGSEYDPLPPFDYSGILETPPLRRDPPSSNIGLRSSGPPKNSPPDIPKRSVPNTPPNKQEVIGNPPPSREPPAVPYRSSRTPDSSPRPNTFSVPSRTPPEVPSRSASSPIINHIPPVVGTPPPTRAPPKIPLRIPPKVIGTPPPTRALPEVPPKSPQSPKNGPSMDTQLNMRELEQYFSGSINTGCWLHGDKTLADYNISNSSVLEFKLPYENYCIKLNSDTWEYKFDSNGLVSDLFDIIVKNFDLENPEIYGIAILGGPFLPFEDRLWSYQIPDNELEIKILGTDINILCLETNQIVPFYVNLDCKLRSLIPKICSHCNIGIPERGNYVFIQNACDVYQNPVYLYIDERTVLYKLDIDFDTDITFKIKDSNTLRSSKKLRTTKDDTNIWDTKMEEGITVNSSQLSDEDYSIAAANVNIIVKSITDVKPNEEFASSFLLSCGFVTDQYYLLERFQQRFSGPVSKISERGGDLNIIKESVCKSIKKWIEFHKHDFDEEFTSQLSEFIEGYVIPWNNDIGSELQEMLQASSTDHTELFDLILSNSGTSKKKKTSKWKGIFECEPKEVAEHFTVIEYDFYSKIKATELLKDDWSKDGDEGTLSQLIKRYNLVGLWICQSILDPYRVRVRAKRYEFLLRVVEQLRELNNFNTLMLFIGALNNSSILRLKGTKGLVSKRLMEVVEQIETELSNENAFKTYRDTLNRCLENKEPCLPYLAVHLSDITKTGEANDDFITSENSEHLMINMAKLRMLYKSVKLLTDIQNRPYQELIDKILNPRDPQVSSSIHMFIRCMESVNTSEEELYNLSLEREPRGCNIKELS